MSSQVFRGEPSRCCTRATSVSTEDAPRMLAGVEPQPGPRHELFVYVSDVDDVVGHLREMGATVLRDPADMVWGERVAYVTDPEGNLVSLANPPSARRPPDRRIKA